MPRALLHKLRRVSGLIGDGPFVHGSHHIIYSHACGYEHSVFCGNSDQICSLDDFIIFLVYLHGLLALISYVELRASCEVCYLAISYLHHSGARCLYHIHPHLGGFATARLALGAVH